MFKKNKTRLSFASSVSCAVGFAVPDKFSWFQQNQIYQISDKTRYYTAQFQWWRDLTDRVCKKTHFKWSIQTQLWARWTGLSLLFHEVSASSSSLRDETHHLWNVFSLPTLVSASCTIEIHRGPRLHPKLSKLHVGLPQHWQQLRYWRLVWCRQSVEVGDRVVYLELKSHQVWGRTSLPVEQGNEKSLPMKLLLNPWMVSFTGCSRLWVIDRSLNRTCRSATDTRLPTSIATIEQRTLITAVRRVRVYYRCWKMPSLRRAYSWLCLYMCRASQLSVGLHLLQIEDIYAHRFWVWPGPSEVMEPWPQSWCHWGGGGWNGTM